MTQTQANLLIDILTSKGVQFQYGLTGVELMQAEQKFVIQFPPDLKLFLQTALPVSGNFFDWRLALNSNKEAEKIYAQLEWPFEGMVFDMENNDFWVDEWGDKPPTFAEKVTVAEKHYNTYPKLIPIFAHRYIPQTPHETGNPVFSVYQMDIIYYGYDLATYFSSEFHFALPGEFEVLEKPLREITFWSQWTTY